MLRDVVSESNLDLYTQLSLVIFFIVFVSIAIRTFRTSPTEIDRCSRMALDNQPTPKNDGGVQ